MRRLALLAALLLLGTATSAAADRIASVRDGNRVIGPGEGTYAVSGISGVAYVRFTHATVLWASFPTSEGSCELAAGEDRVRIADLRPKVEAGQGLCAIWQAPGGTLLADFSNGTLSSAVVYRLDGARHR